MKVIDLLNKIANNEEVPKKIEWEDTIYEYDEEDYSYVTYEYERPKSLMEDVLECDLKREVEIIEEDKEIDYIHVSTETNKYLVDKINELVKAVNELKKGK